MEGVGYIRIKETEREEGRRGGGEERVEKERR